MNWATKSVFGGAVIDFELRVLKMKESKIEPMKMENPQLKIPSCLRAFLRRNQSGVTTDM